MALLPIKLRVSKDGAIKIVVCDTVKDAQETSAELTGRGFIVTAELNDGRVIDVNELDA